MVRRKGGKEGSFAGRRSGGRGRLGGQKWGMVKGILLRDFKWGLESLLVKFQKRNGHKEYNIESSFSN